ncbi:hypothetical protein Q9966_014515 [Columba livia]|nr:hypothetical protein Q9966_014515 [Columba livia]
MGRAVVSCAITEGLAVIAVGHQKLLPTASCVSSAQAPVTPQDFLSRLHKCMLTGTPFESRMIWYHSSVYSTPRQHAVMPHAMGNWEYGNERQVC